MQITEQKFEADLISSPETCFNQLIFAFLEIFRETLTDQKLSRFVYLRYELLIKLPSAHGACLFDRNDLLLAW